jgi:hypothetical protein
MFRTDLNNNPTAFTTDVAKGGGLVLGVDYEQGDSFEAEGKTYYTAKLLGDPIAITIKLINVVGFYTIAPQHRWTYIALPFALWKQLTIDQKKLVIGFMYQMEGGEAMKYLWSPLS